MAGRSFLPVYVHDHCHRKTRNSRHLCPIDVDEVFRARAQDVEQACMTAITMRPFCVCVLVRYATRMAMLSLYGEKTGILLHVTHAYTHSRSLTNQTPNAADVRAVPFDTGVIFRFSTDRS